MCKRRGPLAGLAAPNTDSSDDKPQEARGVGIRTKHKSKLRIGSQIAAGNRRRYAHLMGISLPIPAVGSLRSQHDDIMAKTTRRHIVIAGMSPF